MKNVFTQMGKTAALLLLGCSAVANAQTPESGTVKLASFQLHEDFIQAMPAEGNRTYAKIIMDDTPDLTANPQGGNWIDFDFKKPNKQSFGGTRTQPEINVAGLDSVTLYYRMKGECLHIDNGVVKVAVKDLVDTKNVIINPLEVSRKVIAKKPTDRKGNPLDATLYLVCPKTTELYKIVMDYRSGTEQLLLVDKEPLPYIICPKNVPYFFYEGMSKGLSVDTLTADYRKAKEIHFRMKGLDGQFVPVRDYYSGVNFRNKYSQNENLWSCRDFELNGSYHVDTTYEPQQSQDWVKMYAMPGDYYFSFWGASNMKEQGCPEGLEGAVQIDDREVQELVCDYSQYITLRTRSNMDIALTPTDMLFTRKPGQPSAINKLTENVRFDVMTTTATAYTSVVKDEQGKLCTRIWVPFGYDTAELRGTFGATDYVFENLDIAHHKEFTLDIPVMGALRCIYPHVLYDQGAALMLNDKVIKKVGYADRKHIYRPGDFEKMDTTYAFNGAADVAVSCLFETETDTFRTAVQQVRVIEGDTVEVVIGLDHAVAVDEPLDFHGEERTFSLSVSEDSGMKSFALAKMKSSEKKQTLYLFTGGDKCDYSLSGDRIVPIYGSLVLTDQLQYLTPSWSDHKKFTLTGYQMPNHAEWSDKEGHQYGITINRNDNYFYASPGCITFTTSAKLGRSYSCTYTYNLDFNEDIDYKLPALNCEVKFVRGGTVLIPWGYRRIDEEAQGEVKLYLLKHPYIDENTHLAVFSGHLPSVLMIPGTYCAEDGQGNKVYFEVKAGDRITIDFNNPPVPPVGIDNAEINTTAPAAYYDACGRLLDAPLKGFNVIRLQNGKVIKQMVK